MRYSIKTFIEKNHIQEAIEFHIENEVPFTENIFRMGSKEYFNFFIEARRMMFNGEIQNISSFDKDILQGDLGKFGLYEGEEVPLDFPLIEEEKDVELNKPKRGGSKKYYVYVKNDKGNVIKVEFGDTTGLTAKINDPEARKSFAARHKCAQKKDKTKPGYWACRLPMYAKALGLKGGGSFFW